MWPVLQRLLRPRLTPTARTQPRHYTTGVFSQLGHRLAGVLDKNGISLPTEIQHKVIAELLRNQQSDVVFSAETGSGKTLAYVLPLLHRLSQQPPDSHAAHALVLVPTSELAAQVHEVAREYGQDITGVARLAKGDALALPHGTGMVVATPGALRTYPVESVFAATRAVVLDEADLLLSPSFAADMKVCWRRRVMAAFVKKQELLLPLLLRRRKTATTADPMQFILAAATIPCVGTKSTHETFKKLFPRATFLSTANAHSTVRSLDRQFRRVEEAHKQAALRQELDRCGAASGSGPVLVFAKSSARAEAVADWLQGQGYACGLLHSGVGVDERMDTVAALRRGALDVVVCTDIAARGLDLPNVRTVVEYDFALNVADHMHRAGRTARAGATGTLVCFVAEGDEALASAIAASEGQRLDALFSRKRIFRRRIKRQQRPAAGAGG